MPRKNKNGCLEVDPQNRDCASSKVVWIIKFAAATVRMIIIGKFRTYNTSAYRLTHTTLLQPSLVKLSHHKLLVSLGSKLVVEYHHFNTTFESLVLKASHTCCGSILSACASAPTSATILEIRTLTSCYNSSTLLICG
jgi:hypothetical protein